MMQLIKQRLESLLLFLIWLRNKDTVRLEATSTKVVAKPKLIALVMLLVTARSGHKPIKQPMLGC